MRIIGIIAAEDREIFGLAESLTDCRWEDGEAGVRFLCGNSGELQIVLSRCGIGKVNAAIGTQVMISRYHPDAIINTGSAGAIAGDVHLFDTIISGDCIQHDMDVTGLGYAPGQIPDQEESFFPADPELIRLAQLACEELGMPCRVGRIASGDCFVSRAEKHAELARLFDPACAEMEGAAIAAVCRRNTVPFVILRAISDGAQEDAKISFREFVEIVAERSIRLLGCLIEKVRK